MPEADVRCPRFVTCRAALCPLWPESVAEALWTPGEAVCARRFPGGAPAWLVRQRRLARRGGDPEQLLDVAALQGDGASLAGDLRWVASLAPRPATERKRAAHDLVRAGTYGGGDYLAEARAEV